MRYYVTKSTPLNKTVLHSTNYYTQRNRTTQQTTTLNRLCRGAEAGDKGAAKNARLCNVLYYTQQTTTLNKLLNKITQQTKIAKTTLGTNSKLCTLKLLCYLASRQKTRTSSRSTYIFQAVNVYIK